MNTQQSECSWCSKVLREGTLPVSHGICWDCARLYFPADEDLGRMVTVEHNGHRHDQIIYSAWVLVAIAAMLSGGFAVGCAVQLWRAMR